MTGKITSSWRLKGLTISRFLAVSLLLTALVQVVGVERSAGLARDREQSPPLEESHAGATINLLVTLVGITSYQDFQELKVGLGKSEGVSKVALDSETPGLITLKVTYAGEAVGLIEKLSAFFPKKYDIKEKRLPSGGTEVSISRREGA